MTASPMNFSTVPPYRSMTSRAQVEVAGEELAGVLGVPSLRERREAHEVGEEDGDQAAFRHGAPRRARRPRSDGRRRRGAAPAASGVAHSPQKRMSGSLTAPHDGQNSASGAAQPPQNLRPGRFSVPQFEQTTAAPMRREGPRVQHGAREEQGWPRGGWGDGASQFAGLPAPGAGVQHPGR